MNGTRLYIYVYGFIIGLCILYFNKLYTQSCNPKNKYTKLWRFNNTSFSRWLLNRRVTTLKKIYVCNYLHIARMKIYYYLIQKTCNQRLRYRTANPKFPFCQNRLRLTKGKRCLRYFQENEKYMCFLFSNCMICYVIQFKMEFLSFKR